MPAPHPAPWPRRLLLAGLALSCVLLGRADATNGPKLTGYSARTAGRGGVDYAYADDGVGPATNPAGMAFVYGNRLDNNWVVIDARVGWENVVDNVSYVQPNSNQVQFVVPAFSFGAIFDPSHDWELGNLFRLGDWGLKDEPEAGEQEAMASLSEEELLYGSRIRIGLGVFPLTGGKIQLKDMITTGFGTPGNRRGVDWEADILSAAVTPSLALRVTPWFSVGLNMQLIYSRFELDGGISQPARLLRDDFEFANSILSVNDQIVTDADLDEAFTFGFSWRVGFMFNPTDWLSIGVVYQDRTYNADYLGRATVGAEDEVGRLTNGNPGLLQLVDAAIDPSRGFTSEYDLRIEDFNFPRMFGLGFALRPHRRFSIGVDYTFILWHELYSRFKVRLSNGSNPNLDIMTSPTVDVRVPLKYDDQHVIALGLTVLALEGDEIVEGVPSWQFVLRAGYNFGSNPVPGNTTLPQLPTITEHHLSTGFSLHWGPYVEFSFAFEYAMENRLKTGTHVGDYTLANSEHTAELFLYHFGLGFNF